MTTANVTAPTAVGATGRVYLGSALSRQRPARRYANAAEAERDFRARLVAAERVLGAGPEVER